MFEDPSFGQKQGKAGMSDFYRSVPDIQDSVKKNYVCGISVVVEFVSTGMLPDGKRFRTPVCSILTISNGKIVRDHTYYNNQ